MITMPPPAGPGAPFPDIERLYSSGGLSRSEYRFLLKRKKNKLHWLLANEYLTKLNALRVGAGARIELRGFLHPPPAAILTLFNSIRYQLAEDQGSFEIVIFSPAIDNLDLAIPAIIPSALVPSKTWPRAHFGTIEGTITDFTMFDPGLHGRFVIVTDLNLLSYEEVFRLTLPEIDFHDVCDMFKSRFQFNFPEISKATLYYLFSSPMYEGRAGGNALAPISSSLVTDNEDYRCDLGWIRTVITELHGLLPDWLLMTTSKTTLNYLTPVRTSLRYPTAPILYRYNSPIPRGVNWFIQRQHRQMNERNVSITPFGLNVRTIFISSDNKSQSKDPMNTERAKALSFADIPLLFTSHDGLIDPKETEILDYREDIGQLVYLAQLELGRTILPFEQRLKGVDIVLRWVKKEWPNLHTLMRMGRVFDIGLIGGLGEHLTRLAHSLCRATNQPLEDTLQKSEHLMLDLYRRFQENLEDYTKQEVAGIEEARRSKTEEINHKFRTAIDSALLDLDLLYPEGWSYHSYEETFKRHMTLSKSKLQKLFAYLRQKGDVQECSPGLFKTVRGFERY